MAKLVALVTRQLDQVDDVVSAWEAIGVEGATFLDAFGVRSYQERSTSFEFLAGMRSAFNLLRENQEHSVFLFSIIFEEEQVKPVIAAAESVLGDLSSPDTGLIFVIDLEWVARKSLG